MSHSTITSFNNMSRNKLEPLLTPNIIDRSNSLNRAMNTLRHREMVHPPSTYYIRRNGEYLDKYTDGKEFDKLRTLAPL